MHYFCFEIKIFQVRKQSVDHLSQYFADAGIYFFYECFHAPGKMPDKVKGEAENGAQNRCGETGEQKGNGCEKAEF